MALTNTAYNHAKHMIGAGDLELDAATAGAYKALLVSSTYTPDFDAHQYVSHVTGELASGTNGYARASLASISWAKGTARSRFTSAAVSFAALGGPLVARRMLIFKDTGNAATSPLLFCILLDDTAGGTNVTIADGQTLQVTPDATNGWGYIG